MWRKYFFILKLSFSLMSLRETARVVLIPRLFHDGSKTNRRDMCGSSHDEARMFKVI